jgi:hypothetical protein
MATILEAKRSVERALFAIPGVAGVGINWRDEAIRIYVEALTPEVDAAVPRAMSGYDVEVVVTGAFSSRVADGNFPDPHRRIRWRPAFGGISAGHILTTAGTIGGIVVDHESGGLVALSNNHVFANSTTVQSPSASVGDAILQPAWFDAGTPADAVATLERWIPLDVEGDNLVDCAIARPLSEGVFIPRIVGDVGADGALDGFAVRDVASVVGGEVVHKYGRTTGHTSGTVIDADFTTRIQYPAVEPLVFVDQILACIEVAGGDSGSLLLDSQNRAVGLIVASAKSDGVYYTIANKIRNVTAMLGVEFPADVADTRVPGFDVMRDPGGAAAKVPSVAWVAAGALLGAVAYRIRGR